MRTQKVRMMTSFPFVMSLQELVKQMESSEDKDQDIEFFDPSSPTLEKNYYILVEFCTKKPKSLYVGRIEDLDNQDLCPC